MNKPGAEARRDLRNDLHQQVRQSIEKGRVGLLGGEVPEVRAPFLSANRTKRCKAGDAGL